MVEKRIIKNINNSIPSSNKYKNIETKLDFNGFQNGTSPITKTKKPLKNIVLISAACVAIVLICKWRGMLVNKNKQLGIRNHLCLRNG